MNRSRPPRRRASTTGSAPRADTMAGLAESSLRSSTAPTQDYDDIVEVVQAPTDLAVARVRATDNIEERESPSEITDSSARANDLRAESNFRRAGKDGPRKIIGLGNARCRCHRWRQQVPVRTVLFQDFTLAFRPHVHHACCMSCNARSASWLRAEMSATWFSRKWGRRVQVLLEMTLRFSRPGRASSATRRARACRAPARQSR